MFQDIKVSDEVLGVAERDDDYESHKCSGRELRAHKMTKKQYSSRPLLLYQTLVVDADLGDAVIESGTSSLICTKTMSCYFA